MVGFYAATGALAALSYALAGGAILFICQILARRWRELTWRRFTLAVILATLTATATMLLLASAFDSTVPNESSGLGALLILAYSWIGGGIGGLVVLLSLGWLLGMPRRWTRPDRDAAGVRDLARGGALIAALIPGLVLSIPAGGAVEELVLPLVLFSLGILGLAGLRESIFCSAGDSDEDRRITRVLLWIGIVGAGATTVILLWIWGTSGRFLHRSNRAAFEWIIFTALAVAPIAIEAWQLHKLRRAAPS